MARRSLTVLLAAALAVLALAAPAGARPPKAPASAHAVLRYYDSGGWARDVRAALTRARRDLRRGLAHLGRRRRPAIVLDIDDTTLTTEPCLAANGDAFDGSGASARCIVGGRLPAIRPTRRLYKLARREHVRVFFVTGRPTGLRDVTVANLRRARFRGPLHLVLRPTDTLSDPSVVPYKSAARRDIQRRGFRILVNVGDQRSDLAGGHARRRVRVPNPMYVIP